jgi:hypothetical protein
MKTTDFTQLDKYVSFTRINSDVNGNPRYVCHYLNFKPDHLGYSDKDFNYNDAINAARTIGGKKFHNKQYGGGIVFQSYNILDTAERILLLSGDAIQCHREPTKSEIKFGNGATHYRVFLKRDITKKNGELKKFFKADDNLYYSTK